MTKTDALDVGNCLFRVSNRRESTGLTEIISLTMMLVLPTVSASASEASPWDGDRNSAVRLIAGVPHGEGGARVLRAGIEVKLSRGWKMYWRYPGDAGVPPRFDFSGSQNVSDTAVSWPAPTRFSDAGTHLVVYKDHVVLPLRITPSDPQLPVILRVNLDYGICEKLCVLAEAKLELALAGITGVHEALLTSAERRVPRKVEVGDGDILSIRAVRRDFGTDPPQIVVDILAPERANVDLIAEGPTSDWALPLPQQVSSDGALRRFTFELKGMPQGVETKDALLRLTAVINEQAVEVLAPID